MCDEKYTLLNGRITGLVSNSYKEGFNKMQNFRGTNVVQGDAICILWKKDIEM
jgi:hypothetical protein